MNGVLVPCSKTSGTVPLGWSKSALRSFVEGGGGLSAIDSPESVLDGEKRDMENGGIVALYGSLAGVTGACSNTLCFVHNSSSMSFATGSRFAFD